MQFEPIDIDEYNKPPFLYGWLCKGETLDFAKISDQQLVEFSIAGINLADQFDTDLIKANTALLDRRGALLGLSREGADNEIYFIRQELKILLNQNKSTVPDIIKLLKTFYTAETIHITPDYPAGINILHDGTSPIGIDFNSFIKEVIGAGISYATRELLYFAETLCLGDDNLYLHLYDLDEILYNGDYMYNGFVMYGGQYWINSNTTRRPEGEIISDGGVVFSDNLELRIIRK